MAALLLLSAALVFAPADARRSFAAAERLVSECTPRDAGTIRGRIAANHILDAASAVGANVRRFRLERSMTQKELAERAGLKADYVSRLERGKCNAPLSRIEAIGSILCVPVSELFTW